MMIRLFQVIRSLHRFMPNQTAVVSSNDSFRIHVEIWDSHEFSPRKPPPLDIKMSGQSLNSAFF